MMISFQRFSYLFCIAMVSFFSLQQYTYAIGSLSATSCTIPVNQNSCISTVTFSSSESFYENNKSLYIFVPNDKDGTSIYGTKASSYVTLSKVGSEYIGGTQISLTHGTSTVAITNAPGAAGQVGNLGIQSTSATASCDSGTTWNGMNCTNGTVSSTQSSGMITLGLTGCIIKAGEGSCMLPIIHNGASADDRVALAAKNTTGVPLVMSNDKEESIINFYYNNIGVQENKRPYDNARIVIGVEDGTYAGYVGGAGGYDGKGGKGYGLVNLTNGANTITIRKGKEGTVVGTEIVYASCEPGSTWKDSGTEARLISNINQLGTCVSSTGQNPFATTSSASTTTSNPNAGSALPPPELIITRNYTRLLPGQSGSTNWTTKNVDSKSTLTMTCSNGNKSSLPLTRSGNTSTYDELVAGGWVGKLDCTWTLKGPGGTTVVKDSVEVVPRDQVTSTATTPVRTNTSTKTNTNTTNTNNTTTSPTDTDSAIVVIRDTLSPDTSSLDVASKARIDKIIARVEKRVSAMIVENALKYLDSSIARIKALPNKNAKAKLIDTYTIEKLEDLRDTIAETETDYIGLIDTSLSDN